MAVTTAEDPRTYDADRAIHSEKRIIESYQRIDREPEESFETAAKNTRELKSFVWLGVSRDVRIFEFGLRQPMMYTDYVQPRFHGYGYFWPESEKDLTPPRYGFVAGTRMALHGNGPPPAGRGCTAHRPCRTDRRGYPI